MSSDITRVLREVAASTFENLAFLFPSDELDETRYSGSADATASVRFRGPFTGRLVVRVYGGVLPSIASNMLGGDNAPADQLQRDALGEIANVICGNALPKIGSATDVFLLDAPQVSLFEIPNAGIPTAEARIALEQGGADVLLFVGNSPPV